MKRNSMGAFDANLGSNDINHLYPNTSSNLSQNNSFKELNEI